MSHTPRFHRLSVREVKRETEDAVSISFSVPIELAPDYAFQPGQYLTLRASLEGEDLRRSYSISSGPDDGELRIGVKRIENGVFSGWINDTVKPGDELDVMTPTGRFGLAPPFTDGRLHVGFAAGSGITPILSILRSVLVREPSSRFFLFYGNRSSKDIMFRDEIEDLKDRFLGRLSLFHVLSRQEQDLSVLQGRLDGEKVQHLLGTMLPVKSVDHFFVCGPSEMSEAIEAVLKDIGVAEGKIHIERFVSAFGGRPRVAPILPDVAPTHSVSVILDGNSRKVPVKEEETIIDAALRAGMDLPFSCKGGMCSTCRAKLVEGTVKMDVNYSLEPWELQAGYILTCQSRVTSAEATVDFDQV